MDFDKPDVTKMREFLFILLTFLYGFWKGAAVTPTEIGLVCYENGTIQVTNPDPGTYVSVFTVQGEGTPTAVICPSELIGDKVFVTGCAFGYESNIFLSDRLASDNQSFAGGNWISYCVKCENVSLAGVHKMVTDQLGATLEVTTQDPVTPSFTVTSAIRRTGPDGSIASSGIVGETLFWTIDIPSDYNGQPNCTAYSGSDSSGIPSKFLFDAGCSQDADLLGSDFENEYTSIPNIKRLWVSFYAFQFFNNEYLFLECTVKLCPSSSTSCDLSCPGRRKRSIFGRIRRTADMISGGADEVLETHTTLKIVPNTDNGGSASLGTLRLLIVAVLMVLSRCWINFK